MAKQKRRNWLDKISKWILSALPAEDFTDAVIQKLVERESPIAFVLWGKPAQKKKDLILTPPHCIIESAHPSPLSARRGFFGSRPFSKINDWLMEQQQSPIQW